MNFFKSLLSPPINFRGLVIGTSFLLGLIAFELIFVSQKDSNLIISSHIEQGNYRNIMVFLILTFVTIVLSACFFLSPLPHRASTKLYILGFLP